MCILEPSSTSDEGKVKMQVTHVNLKKKDLENFLFHANGQEPLGYCKHIEQYGESTKPVHLYYDKHGRHLGTYHDGKSWFFNEVYESLKTKESN
jgi:hypothetical protein